MKKTIILPETDEFIVKKSGFLENQFGVFTKKAFKKNQRLFFVKGPVKSKPSIYSFSAGLNEHIEPQNEDGDFDFGHYTNHSCNPNTIVKIVRSSNVPYIKIIARKNIKKGEELTFDYASLEYDTVAHSVCRCNAKNCRGIMHGFKDLPKKVSKKYESEGMIPKYLLKMRTN